MDENWFKSSFSLTRDCVEVRIVMGEDWRISSFCSKNTCVAMRSDLDVIEIRDTKSPDIPPLRFTRDEWEAFLKGVRAGEFNA